MEVVGDVLVVAINEKTAGTSGGVPACLQFEMTIRSMQTSDAGVRKLN